LHQHADTDQHSGVPSMAAGPPQEGTRNQYPHPLPIGGGSPSLPVVVKKHWITSR
jgi:hypothetical protein